VLGDILRKPTALYTPPFVQKIVDAIFVAELIEAIYNCVPGEFGDQRPTFLTIGVGVVAGNIDNLYHRSWEIGTLWGNLFLEKRFALRFSQR